MLLTESGAPMGDISEIRGLVTVVSFIGVTVLLMGLIPPQFFEEEYEGLTVIPPEVFEGIDIQSFKETWNYCLNETGGADKGNYYMVEIKNVEQEFFGGHDLDLWYKKANETQLDLHIEHWYAKWIFFLVSDGLKWTNKKGISRGLTLDSQELDADYSNSGMEYTAECKHLEVKAYFGFNDTLYSSATEAWNYHGLWVFIGINFDQSATAYSAWDLIAMLLFFQLPDIHWFINALISIPLWIAIAYLAFILILRAIGAIFGGGA
jgi:hypothetical protein